MTSLGCVIIGKDPLSLNITQDNLKSLEKELNDIGRLDEKIKLTCKKLIGILNIKNFFVKKYILINIPKIKDNIETAIKKDALVYAFPPLRI